MAIVLMGDTDRVGLVGAAVLIGAAAVASVRPLATSEQRARDGRDGGVRRYCGNASAN
jgi:hypothetical protein